MVLGHTSGASNSQFKFAVVSCSLVQRLISPKESSLSVTSQKPKARETEAVSHISGSCEKLNEVLSFVII